MSDVRNFGSMALALTSLPSATCLARRAQSQRPRGAWCFIHRQFPRNEKGIRSDQTGLRSQADSCALIDRDGYPRYHREAGVADCRLRYTARRNKTRVRSLADQLLQRFIASNCFKVGFLDNYESAIPFMTAHDYDGKLLTANGHTSSEFPQPVNRMRFYRSSSTWNRRFFNPFISLSYPIPGNPRKTKNAAFVAMTSRTGTRLR